MMQNLLIRPASLTDMDKLLHFEQGVINAERPFDETLTREPTHYYNLPEMISSPHIELLVAEIAGQLIGCGYARLEDAKPYLVHRQYAYLGFMYVEPAYRGQGVNRAIMQALEAWVLSKGITELRLEVYFENTAAAKAYEKVGFSKHMIEMRKGI